MANFLGNNIGSQVRKKVVFQSNNTALESLVAKAVAGQTANVFEVENSSGTAVAYIDSSGNLTISGNLTYQDAVVQDALSVTGNATIGGTLEVTGTSTFSGLATFQAAINVAGESTFNNRLTVNSLTVQGGHLVRLNY